MRLLWILTMLLVAACDPLSWLAPEDEPDAPSRRPAGCVRNVDCDDEEQCIDGRCVGVAEGEGEPAEGEGEGEGEGESPEDVVVVLSWSSTDDQRDLDLHLSRLTPPAWCVADDCTWNNRTPGGGAVMETDDINGAGVERIRLSSSAVGTYAVGVATYRTTAPITARVVITQGARTLSDVSAVIVRSTLWQPAVVTVSAVDVSATSTNGFGTADGDCLGDAETPGGFGTPCADDSVCRSDLQCSAGICTVTCLLSGVCNQCTNETRTRCTCNDDSVCIPGA